MRLPLVRKELREQRPFLFLGLFLVAMDVLELLLLRSPDLQPLAATFRGEGGEGAGVMLMLLTFSLSAGLLTRERDEGTLEFLDALPVTRARLFWVKVAVALPVLMVYPVGSTLLLALKQAASRTSLDTGLHLGTLATGLSLEGALVLCVLALGLFLSHLRSLSWLVLGVLSLALVLLEEQVPVLDALNPLTLARAEFMGSRWRVPWPALQLQLPLALALLLAALALYAGAGQGALSRLAARLEGRFTRWVVRLATVGVAVGCAGVIGMRSADETPDEGEEEHVSFPQATRVEALTHHYRFGYPSTQSAQAAPLLDEADAVFERVRDFLGAAAVGAPVEGNLSGSAPHTLGTAHWDTLRMTLDGPPEQLRATLAHETTHVLASRLVGADASLRLGALRLFNEGLATYVEQRFFPVEGERERHRFVAAVMSARGQLRLEELLDPELLQRTRDDELVYPLGSLLVESLVARHGDGAPARVLRALGRPEAAEDLSVEERWQDAFAAAGVDLPRVVDDLFTHLDLLAQEQAGAISALPRPRATLVRERGELTVRARLEGPLPPGWRVVCRFRRSEDSPSSEYDGPYVHDGAPERAAFSRWPRQVAGGRLWYQLGVQGLQGPVLYEPWASLPVDG